jgi:outer membrane protein
MQVKNWQFKTDKRRYKSLQTLSLKVPVSRAQYRHTLQLGDNMTRTSVIALLFIASMPFAAVAEATSLEGAYQAALIRSEDLAGQAEQVIQAEERLTQARAALYPSINGVGSYQWQDPATSSILSDQRTVKIAATWSLFRGFRDFCAIRQAGTMVKAQALARQWASLQLYSDTAQAYYQALAQDLDQQHLSEQLKITKDRVADLRHRVAIGRSRPSDLLSTRAAAASLAAQVEASQASLVVALETLAFLTGDAQARPQDMGAMAFTAGSVEDWLKQALARPDLIAARSRAEAAQTAARAAQAGHLPSVDATANYYADRLQAKPWMAWDAGLAITLPLFSGFATSAKAAEISSQAREAQLAAARLERSSAQQVRSLYAVLSRGLSQVEALREAQGLAKSAYDALKKDYDLGLATNQDVLQSLNAYQDASRALDRARAQACISQAQLKAASAALPETLKNRSAQ